MILLVFDMFITDSTTVPGTQPGSVTFKWQRNGLTFKGNRKMRSKNVKSPKTKRQKTLNQHRIGCHKSKCKYYFYARCKFKPGEDGFLEADNWETVMNKRSVVKHEHALIETDEAKLSQSHPTLVSKTSASCNVPPQKFALLKHRNEMKVSSSSSTVALERLIQRGDDDVKSVESVIKSQRQQHICHQFDYRRRLAADDEINDDEDENEIKVIKPEQ